MLEQLGPSIALLLVLIFAMVRWRLWQREQEAKALLTAIRRGDCAELSYLLAGRPNLDLVYTHFGEPAIILAVTAAMDPDDCIAIADLLLRRGAGVDEQGTEWKTALMHAAERGHAGLCQLLLEHGADASACDLWGQTAADIATASGNERALRVLAPVRIRLR